MKVGEHIIPFTMKNSIASMYFRRPTEEELEECDMIQLTSDAQWDPKYISGRNFKPSSDPHYYRKAGVNINNTVTTVDDVDLGPKLDHM